MTTEAKEIQVVEVQTLEPAKEFGFMNPTSLKEALEVAEYFAKSSMCPKAYKDKPGDVLICLQKGQELKIAPMVALEGIAVINGKACVYGDLLLALCRRAPAFEYIDEQPLDLETMTATCKVKRRNEPPVIRSFSQADAVKAKLWGKDGPWTLYPNRMLQMRARAWALRDCFTDQLQGIYSAEEAYDLPPEDWSDVTEERNLSAEINDAQVKELRSKLQACNRDELALCNHLHIDCIESMKVGDWIEMNRILDQAIARKEKAAKAPINNAMKEGAKKPVEPKPQQQAPIENKKEQPLNSGFEAAENVVDDFFDEEI